MKRFVKLADVDSEGGHIYLDPSKITGLCPGSLSDDPKVICDGVMYGVTEGDYKALARWADGESGELDEGI